MHEGSVALVISQDPDIKDQGGVQHVLREVINYLQSKGKWAAVGNCASCGECLGETVASHLGREEACPSCGGMSNYFLQSNIDPLERTDQEYYQGRGAPAPGRKIAWLKAFSDGCSQQFMNATFLLFLSQFMIMFALNVVWNWFCSCHGKCFCDPEGGSLKSAAEAFEAKDSSLSERRSTIRNARELVMFGRAHLEKPSKDFYSKEGAGVFRRFFHFVPVQGRGSVNRRLVQKAESAIVQKGTMERVKIRSLRRVASSG